MSMLRETSSPRTRPISIPFHQKLGGLEPFHTTAPALGFLRVRLDVVGLHWSMEWCPHRHQTSFQILHLLVGAAQSRRSGFSSG
jgi:hypothetical protein